MLFQRHRDFTEARVNAFVCDLTIDDLYQHISPSSVDIVTMVRMKLLILRILFTIMVEFI